MDVRSPKSKKIVKKSAKYCQIKFNSKWQMLKQMTVAVKQTSLSLFLLDMLMDVNISLITGWKFFANWPFNAFHEI